jgi:hypothetical protein
MIEGSYHLRTLVEANTKNVQLVPRWMHRIEPRFEHRGLLRNTVARLGCTMVRLGTSLERLAQMNEQVPVDI